MPFEALLTCSMKKKEGGEQMENTLIVWVGIELAALGGFLTLLAFYLRFVAKQAYPIE